jgi:hypothetical protein
VESMAVRRSPVIGLWGQSSSHTISRLGCSSSRLNCATAAASAARSSGASTEPKGWTRCLILAARRASCAAWRRRGASGLGR